MKQKIILTILIAFYINTNAQTSFKKIISTYDYQDGFYITEDDNNNYVILGCIKFNNRNTPNIIKINKYGDFVKDTIIDKGGSNYKMLLDIKYFNNNYYAIGYIGDSIFQNLQPYNTKIILLKFDTCLNLIKEDTIAFSSVKWIGKMNFIIDSDTNIVIYGLSQWYHDTIVWDILNQPFLYKVNINGDYISYKEPQIYEINNIVETADKTGYYSLIADMNANNFEKLDKNLNVLEKRKILDINQTMLVRKINNDTLIVVGSNNNQQNTIVTIDTSCNTINKKNFTLGLRNISFDKKNNNFFFAEVVNNVFNVYKLNSDLSIAWEKTTGGDVSYQGSSILATNDGGCVIVGNRFDPATQIANEQLDIYVVKIAPDGTIQWENSIPVNTQINIYPNPGSNLINIQTEKTYNKFTMFDISGKQVLSQTGGKKNINTSNLPTGVYIYKLTGKNNKVLQTGKWVKQ